MATPHYTVRWASITAVEWMWPLIRTSPKACGCGTFSRRITFRISRFRGAMREKATGPHIHIGPMSGHLAQGG